MIKLKNTIKKGLNFGLTSGAITTLGLITGLDSTTGSKFVVISGVITIAIADAFSDALGAHISEESTNNNKKDVWEVTISTFLTKFLFALSFLLPMIFLKEGIAIICSILWGIFVIVLLSYRLAKDNNEKPVRIIFEHLLMALIVIFSTNFIGHFLAKTLKN